MGRRKLKPDYNPERIMKELINITKDLYDKKYSYRKIALVLELSVSKVVKLLITGGIYSSNICRKINKLYNSGKSISEIQKRLNVSRTTVQAYLPYKKCVYKAKELSLNAERIKRYRAKKKQETVLAENLAEQTSNSTDSSSNIINSYPDPCSGKV